ncbi:hypothetical protein [Undibacterium squillarum]|jgi:hypothetical protein|uniref:Uncharacterized protein n=1 Tax=Undibacterium squillarum TaxID=1131567 RepID=A0ABQ2XVW7_9BURK|nr:hypothetical protein [Undibacterium squillarum]GGX35458.1 hypothetical protein GCM10010946_11130 [Undibacterium squillarum]
MTTTTVGGWSAWGPVTPEEKTIFAEALHGFVGVNYTPQQVATQLVAGTNYRYKCLATLPGEAIGQWEAIVQIYQPLKGAPHITHITPV